MGTKVIFYNLISYILNYDEKKIRRSKAFFVLDILENWYFPQICCDVIVFKKTHCLFISVTLVPRRHTHKFATK